MFSTSLRTSHLFCQYVVHCCHALDANVLFVKQVYVFAAMTEYHVYGSIEDSLNVHVFCILFLRVAKRAA